MFGFKFRLGSVKLFTCFFIINLWMLSISRLGLALWQEERVSQADNWIHLLLQGMRVDVSTLCWLFGVPMVLSLLLGGDNRLGKIWLWLMRGVLVSGTLLLLFLELSTPAFINTYDLRPNRIFVEYLSYPQNIANMLLKGHLAAVVVVFAVLPLAAWALWRLSAYVSRASAYPNVYWRPVLALAVLLIAFLGARSSLGHRGLNPALVSFSSDPLVNSLVLNSTYSVAFAVKQLKNEEKTPVSYGQMSDQELLATLRQASGRPEGDFISDELPTLTVNKASYRGTPKNLVIILEESLGAQFVGTLGGKPLTPRLDELAQQGWLLEQLYATGTRSVRGIEAVVTGFTPTQSSAVVKLDKSQTGFFTIAQLLKQKGYSTEFIYGGEGHFDNMASFFLGNGFERVVDQRDYSKPVFEGSWGVSDEDLFTKAHQEFERLHQTGKPFFSLVFSSSNHDPFEFPDGRIELYEQPKNTRNNAAKYADYAVGTFFDKAKQGSYWNDTVFLIVADHDSRVYGADLVPVKHFHIPGLILGSGIKPQRDSRLSSQIDLPPTLLSLIGIDSENPMLGRDLTQLSPDDPGRALMQFDNNFALLRGDRMVVLQPEKSPVGFTYHKESQRLSPSALDADLAKQALAYSLWGHLAYNQRLYRLPENKMTVAKH